MKDKNKTSRPQLATVMTLLLMIIGLFGVGSIAVGLLKESSSVIWGGICIIFIYALLQLMVVIVWHKSKGYSSYDFSSLAPPLSTDSDSVEKE